MSVGSSNSSIEAPKSMKSSSNSNENKSERSPDEKNKFSSFLNFPGNVVNKLMGVLTPAGNGLMT